MHTNRTKPTLPERLLILDTSADPARWVIATVTLDTDTREAVMTPDGRRYDDWPAVTDWAREQVGQKVCLVPAAAIVWRVDAPAVPKSQTVTEP